MSSLQAFVALYREFKNNPACADEIASAFAQIIPSMDQIAESNAAGLLPAHILFFRANAEIAGDYPVYREKNRNKLRAYLTKYYLHLP